MYGYKDNRSILEDFNSIVKGHTEIKKALITLFNKSRIRYNQKHKHFEREPNLIETNKILIMGPSGQGKTYMVDTIADLIDAPVVKIDATSLSPTGASSGIDPIKFRKKILDFADSCVNPDKKGCQSKQEVLDQMIVIVDEIDKLAKPSDSTGRWNKHTQECFLTVFEPKGDLAGLSFIFMGAFTEITEQLKNKHKSFGFYKEAHEEEQSIDWDKEVIDYGLVPELVGRLNGIYHLDTLTQQDYKDILYTLLVPNKATELYYFHHTSFSLPEEEGMAIVKKAMNSGQGIRSMKRQLDAYCQDIQFYYEDKLMAAHIENTKLLNHKPLNKIKEKEESILKSQA